MGRLKQLYLLLAVAAMVSACRALEDPTPAKAAADSRLVRTEEGPIIRPNVESVRLVNGTAPNNGFLEIRSDGQWSSVAYTVGGPEDRARVELVACRMLGYNDTVPILGGIQAFFASVYHPRFYTGRVQFPWGFNCTGAEASLGACATSDSPPVPGYSGPDYAYYVFCTPKEGWKMTDLRLVNSSYPIVESQITRSLGGAQNASIQPVAPEAARGRIDVWVAGLWGTVLDVGFGQNEAVVACRSLGFTDTTKAAPFSLVVLNPKKKNDALRFGTSEPVWVKRVSCTGSEPWLGDCAITWCDVGCATAAAGGENVGVRCA